MSYMCYRLECKDFIDTFGQFADSFLRFSQCLFPFRESKRNCNSFKDLLLEHDGSQPEED